MSKQSILESLNKAVNFANLTEPSDLVIFASAAATLDALGDKKTMISFSSKIKEFYPDLKEFAQQILKNTNQRIENAENKVVESFGAIWELQQNYFLFKNLWGEKENWPLFIQNTFTYLDNRAYSIPKSSETYAELCLLPERAEIPKDDCISSLKNVVETPIDIYTLQHITMTYSFCPAQEINNFEQLTAAADNPDEVPDELIKLMSNNKWQDTLIAGDIVSIKNILNDNWEIVFEIKSDGLHPQYYFWGAGLGRIQPYDGKFQFKISLDKTKTTRFNIKNQMENQIISIYFDADQILKIKLLFK